MKHSGRFRISIAQSFPLQNCWTQTDICADLHTEKFSSRREAETTRCPEMPHVPQESFISAVSSILRRNQPGYRCNHVTRPRYASECACSCLQNLPRRHSWGIFVARPSYRIWALPTHGEHSGFTIFITARLLALRSPVISSFLYLWWLSWLLPKMHSRMHIRTKSNLKTKSLFCDCRTKDV